MTANRSPDAAVHDADLVRYLDGELDAADRTRIEDALAADSALSLRLEQLRGRGARLTSLLEATDADPADPPASIEAPQTAAARVIELNAAWAAQQGVEPHIVPPPRPMPGWLRAAAIVALLLTGSFLVPPVRAWIAETLSSVTGGGEVAGRDAEPAATVPVDTLVVRFATMARTFTIEFAAAPAEGRLAVDRLAVDTAVAELYTRGGSEDLQRIREDWFRIANAPSSTADYRFNLPARVNEVIVRIPGRADVAWRFAPEDSARVLDLGS